MKSELKKYRDRFKKYNEYELSLKKDFTDEERIMQYFSLLKFGYEFILPERLEQLRNEKYDRMRKLRGKFERGKKKIES
jgi:hypothetical protein